MSQNLSKTSNKRPTFPSISTQTPLAFPRSVFYERPPEVFKLDVSQLNLTDEQFIQIEKANPDWKIELSGKGELIFMPGTGFITGVKNSQLIFLVSVWADKNGTGLVADSSTVFVFPNGAKRSPDVSWMRRDRLREFTEEQLQKFARLAPDFVIELRSASDSLPELQNKMAEYAENGVRLAWLIDLQTRRVHIYRENQAVEILENPAALSGAEVLNNFTLDLAQIWETKIA